MDRETFANQEVASYLRDNFIVIKVNTEKARDLAEMYSAFSLPTSWFVNPAGEPIAPLPGFVPPDPFLAVLKYINTKSYAQMTFKEFVEKDLHKN